MADGHFVPPTDWIRYFKYLCLRFLYETHFFSEKQETVQGMITSERRKLDDLQNDAMFDALVSYIIII